jgi:hypothetical protein
MKTKVRQLRKERMRASGMEGVQGASRWPLVPMILLPAFAQGEQSEEKFFRFDGTKRECL